ncbi:NAD(P)-binding Rossmann-fold superfamily protein [Actinidia rufa]|uniref:NAD(P)-binding Rossmann-fold superfamily protein n=1 Tax=Actinidia rufa TaxID=165716 RepID=A0A7J0GFJ7_9ERIC|nr:NAD(P)-binding Rossmann-fold superfamily protein [Actinidia rufa]
MADDNPIRFGLIGCAEIARKLSRAIDLAPNTTLSAISSRSIEKAQQFRSKNGLPETVTIYGSYDQVLDDPQIDAVYMPLPTSLLVKWAVLAAQKKKHLLLEKPTALDVGELDEILEACRSNGVQFMDGTMWYHHPRTAKMKELVSDSLLFGQLRSIHSTSTFTETPEFFEHNIRVKPDLDALGALGDTGWYCIGAILWAMNHRLATTVVASPPAHRNSAGIILSCTASLHWDDVNPQAVATFHCSFLSHVSMDLALRGSNGSVHLEDFIIPYEESCAFFDFTSGAKFADLHIGWNVKPERVEVSSTLPQEALMVQEFGRLVKGVRDCGRSPDEKWPEISRMTQLVLDAVNKSIDLGFVPISL